MTDLPVINLPQLEADPLRELAHAIEDQAQANFYARFAKDITVTGKRVEDPGGPPRVEFRFTLAKPGLLPTAQERMWFDGFIAGYRCASSVIHYLLTPPDGTTPS